MARGKAKTAARGIKKGARGGATAVKTPSKGVKKSKKPAADALKVQNEAMDSSDAIQSGSQESGSTSDSEASEEIQTPVEQVKQKKSTKSETVKKSKKEDKNKIEKTKNGGKKNQIQEKEDSDDQESDSDDEFLSAKNNKNAQAHVQKDESGSDESEEDSVDEIATNNRVDVESDQDEENEDDDNQEEDKEESESSEEVLPKKVPNKIKKIDVPQKENKQTNSNRTTDENPPANRVFISNLSKTADSAAIQEFFTAHDLTTVDLYIPGSEKFHKGYAFAEFEDIETATRATELSGQNIAGSPVDITYARPKKSDQGDRRNDGFKQNKGGFQKSGYGGQGGPTNIIFVKNLSSETTEDDLRKHFRGSQEVRMMKNQDGSCRGHAYIEYDNQNSAKSAKENLTGSEISGSRVILDFAQPRGQGRDDSFRRNDSFRGGFRGGRRDGGFRGGRFQRGGRDFGGRGGYGGNRGGYGGVGKSSRGFNKGPMGKRTQFNDDDD